MMQEIFDISRAINQYLGVAVIVAVGWRGVPLALDRERWRSWRLLHRVLAFHALAGYGVASALGSIYYEQHLTEASAVASFVLVLNVAVIALCVFWPHPVREADPRFASEGF